MALPPRRLVVLALALAGVLAGSAAAAPPLSPSTVGEPPNGGGVFRFPQAVTFSPGGGSVFVGDQYGGAIQVFDPDGGFRFSFGARAVRREPGRIGVVGGVATDHSGHVYVLDSENDRVQVFAAADGRPLASFGDSSTLGVAEQISTVNGGISAGGLAVFQPAPDAAPAVYVADPGLERIERFTLDAGTLTPTGPPQTSDPSLGLANPQGVALDPGGTRLYVADDDNDRIVVLDPRTLGYVTQTGSRGTGPGQFRNPYDVAVDSGAPSRLYVADNLNNRVDVFDSGSLAFLSSYGGFGRLVGQFSIVRAVGALGDDPRGGVDVADTANNRIQALAADGTVEAAWGIAGRGPGYVTRPRGVAFTPDGGVAVADTFDHRIERFDPDGTFGGQLGLISSFNGYATQGSAPGQFSLPAGVASDAAGDTWVADTGNDRVVELAADGSVLFTSAAGEFSGPVGIARGPGGSMYVADTAHGRIAQVAPGGVATTLRSGLSRPAAVAWDGGSHVYLADATHVLDLAGGEVTPPPGERAWDRPAGLAVDQGSGTLYVAERRPGIAVGARVLRGTPAAGGGFTWDVVAGEGSGPGEVIDPGGLAVSPDGGTLLVADAGNDRVLRLDAPEHAPPDTPALTVAVDAITRGVVTSDLPGISCATDCVQHYGSGRRVTLSATPAGGSAFLGWSGACAPAGAATTCTVTMSGAQAVGALFGTPVAAPAPPPPPPPAQPPPPPPAPVRIVSVRVVPSRLHLARPRDRRPAQRATRARVIVTLTRPATLTVGVEAARAGRRSGSRCLAPTRRTRRRARCTRWVALAGRRTPRTTNFRLTPAVRGRPLRPGRYRLAVIALDTSGNRVGPATALFRVTR